MLTNDLPKIMLVDMNSFFASVEQQANPFLRGKPVGIGNSLHETSCLIATSKEAKALGIKTGTLVYKAKKIYPKIIVIQSEPEKYREVHRRINRIFQDYTEAVEAYSIDESFLDLRESKLNPLMAGSAIKKRIKEEVGEWLTCSVGIAPNKFMAKLAADSTKPDGLSVMWQENLPAIYKHKKFTDLWGISRGWERRLARLGIISPLQLLGYPVQNLISVFGKPGYFIWERVNGLEQDEISDYPSPLGGGWHKVPGEGELIYLAETPSLSPLATSPPEGENYTVKNHLPKSFGHSWVLNFRTTEKERLRPVILRLAEKAARRMRAAYFKANGIGLSVTLVDGTYFARTKKLKFAVDSGLALFHEVMGIWKSWVFTCDVLHIAVRFTHLSVRTKQLGLFDDKDYNLSDALDSINDKYGEFTVRSGLLAETENYTPDAIAFGKQ